MLFHKKIICSFDHGYFKDVKLKSNIRPAILKFEKKKVRKYSYPFFRSPQDFIKNNDLILGDVPTNKKNLKFKKLPRFGFTGITKSARYILKLEFHNCNRQKI